jgi:hypothetical protein
MAISFWSDEDRVDRAIPPRMQQACAHALDQSHRVGFENSSPCLHGDGRRWLLVGRLERERAVRPVSVGVGGVEADHVLEVAAVDDQDPVQALAAEGAEPTLGVGVRVWGSDGRADDLHVLAAKDLIESVTEFAVAVVEQEPEGLLPVGEEHQQFRACCATQRRSGLFVLVTNSIRRRSSETKKRT